MKFLLKLTFHDWKGADPDKLIDDMDFYELDGKTLSDLLVSYTEHVTKSWDKNALEKKRVCERTHKPWYTKDLRTQFKIVRNHEHVLRKYMLDHQWTAFRKEPSKYS